VGLVREIGGGPTTPRIGGWPWIAVVAMLPPTRRWSRAGVTLGGHDAA